MEANERLPHAAAGSMGWWDDHSIEPRAKVRRIPCLCQSLRWNGLFNRSCPAESSSGLGGVGDSMKKWQTVLEELIGMVVKGVPLEPWG